MGVLETCDRQPALAIPYLLMASYLYYIRDEVSPLSDSEFDRLCKWASLNWKKIQHPHKHLIKKAWLDAGSLFQLREAQYPLMVQGAAYSWMEGRKLAG